MKHEAISGNAEQAQSVISDLGKDILNIMEQGILVWSGEGICELHNSRIFDLLELSSDDLAVGSSFDVYRRIGLERGDIHEDDFHNSESRIKLHQPYSYDRSLPSGRVVLTSARPARGGGYVVTYTDVTEARSAARELTAAKNAAEKAEARARDVLTKERARRTEAKLLGQLDEWLQCCKSLDELFAIVTNFMERFLPGSKGELYIYSNSRDVLDGMCNWNTTDLHDSIQPDSCWALRRGRNYQYNENELCFVCDHVEAHQHKVHLAEYICVPIVAHGDTVGLLHIRFAPVAANREHIHDEAEFAILCGEHISMAIANVKLRDELQDQSVRDPLTGLYNRRYFLEAVRQQISQSERRGQSFGLLTFDADKFKNFNDNHGHDAGDMVLRAIGATMQEVMNNGEVTCRFGGEEFAILLPGHDLDAARDAAETLREAISAMQVRYLDGVLPMVTISVGVSSFPDCGNQPQQLLRSADEALYRAKDAGRNCVMVATNDQGGPD